MLNQIILDMRSQLVRAKQQSLAAIRRREAVQDQTKQELKESEDWEAESDARGAAESGRARQQALMRRTEHISRGEQMQLSGRRTSRNRPPQGLVRSLTTTSKRRYRKKEFFCSRTAPHRSAESASTKTMSHISEKSAFEAFARMEEKIESNERK